MMITEKIVYLMAKGNLEKVKNDIKKKDIEGIIYKELHNDDNEIWVPINITSISVLNELDLLTEDQLEKLKNDIDSLDYILLY